MRILIVDDNKESLYMLEVLLRSNGYEVETATDGVEALEKVRGDEFDMIISDILMPRMDGFQLCRQVKTDERLKNIAFVFYTATYTDPKDEELALSLGAEKFIIKPQEPHVFVELLREIIRSHEAGTLVAPRPPVEEEVVYLREYNERLIKKLEDKLEQLERANKKLAESETRLRTILETEPECVKIVASDGTLLDINPAGLAMIEADSLEQVVGNSIYDLVAEEHREGVRRLTESAFEGNTGSLEFKIIGLKGTPRWVETRVAPLRNERGEIIGALGVARDITERKNLEEQFRQAQKMEAIGRLAGGIAHDFNNLLTVITGYSEMALTQLGEHDPRRKYIEQVKNAGERAASLTRQLLIFSRQQVLEPKVLNLNAVIGNVEKMLEPLIGEDIKLKTVLEPTLERVKVDQGQIEQVIINLAVNARDAMPQGGTLTIETANVELDEEYARQHIDVTPGRYVLLAVSDTGCGMDAETMSHIFEPFFTTKEVGEGTGLGLSTVYGIVTQSGGHIEVESEVGRGTTFKIYLPQAEETAELLERRAIRPELPRGTETILLVEDDETVRGLAREILQMSGYTVLEASQGQEALELVGQHEGPIHLLLTDVVMPQMSGPELASRLAAVRPEMKVLYISGYAEKATVHHQLLEQGASLLRKPFEVDDLVLAVREVLDK